MTVTYEQAVKLKELGFDKEVIYYYRNWYKEIQLRADHSSNFNAWYKTVDPMEECVSAPYISEALQWIRDEKGIQCSVTLIVTANVDFIGYSGFFIQSRILEQTIYYGTYQGAERALLNKLLTCLEKK